MQLCKTPNINHWIIILNGNIKLILNNYMKTLKLCWDLEDQFLDINLPRRSYEFIPPMGIVDEKLKQCQYQHLWAATRVN